MDVGDVDLSHLRVQKTGEHDLALTAEGAAELPGFGDGSGGAKEPEKSPLSELTEKFNEKFGTDFTPDDFITPFTETTEDPKVRGAAVNDEANFARVRQTRAFSRESGAGTGHCRELKRWANAAAPPTGSAWDGGPPGFGHSGRRYRSLRLRGVVWGGARWSG